MGYGDLVLTKIAVDLFTGKSVRFLDLFKVWTQSKGSVLGNFGNGFENVRVFDFPVKEKSNRRLVCAVHHCGH